MLGLGPSRWSWDPAEDSTLCSAAPALGCETTAEVPQGLGLKDEGTPAPQPASDFHSPALTVVHTYTAALKVSTAMARLKAAGFTLQQPGENPKGTVF